MTIESEKENEYQARSYSFKAGFVFVVFCCLGFLNPMRLLPGFEAVDVHFLYLYAFMTLIVSSAISIPIWAYVFGILLFDLIYGLGAYNIPVLVVFCLGMQILRAKNLSWYFLYAWCVFGLSVCFVEFARYSILAVMKNVPIDMVPFLYVTALNIVIFPLVYSLLPRTERRL